ncbi:hypothetical protein Tco_1406135 [Tanacetum coccineum]
MILRNVGVVTQQSQAEFPQLDSGVAVPTFQQGKDLIDCINKAIAFLSAMVSRFPSSNDQLKMSSNPCNQATIQDGRVTVQQVQGRQTQSFVGIRNRGIATTLRGNYAAAFLTEDLDSYDSDCDDISLAKAVLMENLSSCDLDVVSEGPYSDTYPNDMINQDVQEMSYSEQTHIVNFPDNEITSDSNIIPHSQYLQGSQNVVKKRSTSDAISADVITEVQTIFNQMEAAVNQCSVDKNVFEIQTKNLRIDNDQLLNQIMSQEIMHIAMNSVDILDVSKSCVDKCNKCLELETELLKKKDLIEKDVYDKLLKSYSILEKLCISLELATQLNQEIFQKDNSHLNAQLKEKVFAIATLKNELSKFKGKNVADTVISTPIATTIAPGMFKLDTEPISHRFKNNRDAHEVYLKKTIENTKTLRGLVEYARKQNPSEPLLESACMFTKHVQELLVYVSKTCPNLPKPSEKLVAITPLNKDKKVKFSDPLTS